ncbi:MAG: enoyl-CoA hydratase/isomerase family protein, partial [Chloroflexi bacterium]|nr:enoyl-CoA hydratase/isomerase family protein [Chloroflexota bacterium]
TRLPRAVPRAVAMKMCLTGEPISAQEALRWGLVSDVVPLPELMPLAHKIADRINENAPLAVRACKEMVMKGLDLSLEGSLSLENDFISPLVKTDDFKEGPRAFAEKRKPNFKGR